MEHPTPVRGTALGTAAEMLEESRAERAHLGRRPGDRPYLRSSAKTLILEDFANQPASDPWQAAMAAGLVLARRDAGILDPDETEPLQQVVEGILGPDTLDTLASIWTAAHATGDEDGQTMLEHARAWCQALATEPHQPEPTPMPQGSVSSELAEAISKVVAQVAANEAAEAEAEARVAAARTARAKAKANEAAQARQAARTAEKVFAPGGRPYTPDSAPGAARPARP